MSTLLTIRGNVRRNLGDSDERYYTDAELNQYIGEAYRKYTILMIDEGDGYFETTTYLDLTLGTATISVAALTPVFYKIRLLSRVMTDGSTAPLRRDELRNKISFKNTVTGNGYMPTYRMQGNNVVLTPVPAVTETGSSTAGLKLDYYYIPEFPVSDSDDDFEFSSMFPTIYEPLIELEATIAAMEAKDAIGGVADISTFRSRRDEYKEGFVDSLDRDDNIESVTYKGVNYSRPW